MYIHRCVDELSHERPDAPRRTHALSRIHTFIYIRIRVYMAQKKSRELTYSLINNMGNELFP